MEQAGGSISRRESITGETNRSSCCQRSLSLSPSLPSLTRRLDFTGLLFDQRLFHHVGRTNQLVKVVFTLSIIVSLLHSLSLSHSDFRINGAWIFQYCFSDEISLLMVIGSTMLGFNMQSIFLFHISIISCFCIILSLRNFITDTILFHCVSIPLCHCCFWWSSDYCFIVISGFQY